MHDLSPIATHAQHAPAGWTFPTLAVPATAGAAGPGPSPVSGTVTRLRWGRLLPVLAGLALLAFGAWTMSQDGAAAKRRGLAVSGGGSDAGSAEVDIARAARAPQPAAAAPSPRPGAGSARSRATGAAPARRAAARARARSAAARPRARRAAASRPAPARRGARRGMAVAPALPAAPASAATAPRTVTGGGSHAAGELPLTGIESWIAGTLGLLLLAAGIGIHVNAVRLAAIAMLYRRGLLLRPVDCARMAQQRGIPRARVALSGILHRLLEEPSGGDFVSTRLAR